MRKLALVLLLSLIVAGLGYSEDLQVPDQRPQRTDPPPSENQAAPTEYTPLVFSEYPGAFAYWRDTRGPSPIYAGLCFLGGNELYLRFILPSTGAEISFSQTFFVTPAANGRTSRIEPGPVRLITGDLGSEDAIHRLRFEIYEWMQVWLDTRSRFEEFPAYQAGSGGDVEFEYWIPVFQFRSAGLPDKGVSLATVGLALEPFTDPAFNAFAGFSEPKKGPVTKIAAQAEQEVFLDGLSIKLDGNWGYGTDGYYRIGSAKTPLAWITAEGFDLEDAGIGDTFDLIKLLLLYSGPQMIGDSFRVFVYDEYPCIFYMAQDNQTGLVHARYRMFVPREGARLSIVTLCALESVFTLNREYFESLLFGDAR